MTYLPFENLQDGCAAIAGGSGGLGRDIVRKFASVGSNVAFSYLSREQPAKELEQEIQATGQGALAARVDLTDPASIRSWMAGAREKFGKIHTLVYACGPTVVIGPIADLTPEQWAAAVNADLNGFFNLCHVGIPYLRESRGSIVALSTAGIRRYPAMDITSAGPKAGVEMLVNGITREEGRNGIRANCVAVGQIDAGQGRDHLHDPRFERLAERVVRNTPLRRMGQSEEIANAVLFFASSMASFVSGESICVDGGGHV
ncbi:MAG: SDR family oxidoreductase [Pseudomonadota bacterium]